MSIYQTHHYEGMNIVVQELDTSISGSGKKQYMVNVDGDLEFVIRTSEVTNDFIVVRAGSGNPVGYYKSLRLAIDDVLYNYIEQFDF